MIKLVYCIRKRDDVGEAEFHRYWLEEHGPKVKSVAAAIGARRYVQSHTVLPELNASFLQPRGLAEPYDGITELWWDSLEDMAGEEGAEARVAAARLLLEDETRFINFGRSHIFMTEEHEVFAR